MVHLPYPPGGPSSWRRFKRLGRLWQDGLNSVPPPHFVTMAFILFFRLRLAHVVLGGQSCQEEEVIARTYSA